jgi:poly(A) polymerase
VTLLPEQAIAVPAAQLVMKTLTEAGHRALFVGGTVRNALLGAAVTDFDIATDAEPTQVMALAEAASLRVVLTGLDHGTVTLVVDGQPFEVTTFRRDVVTHGRRATVAFSTDLAEDALRRDFTMNALYAEADGTVVDPLGGLADLTARRVRFVGAPEDRIREDYLRILRFFRFSAWFADPGEGLDADGLAACAELADGMQQLSAERVWSEIKKLLSAPDPAWVVAPMAQAGVLARCLPGATATSLAPLIHAEHALELLPDPLRRLVALGGDRPESHLRLSRAEARQLNALRNGVEAPISALELGHTLGSVVARDVIALRFALLETLFSEAILAEIDKGAAAEFPVRASDLPPDLRGPQIGQTLARLRATWLAERCAPSKADLITRI